MTAAAGVFTEVGFCGQVLLPLLFMFLLLKLKALPLRLTEVYSKNMR